MKVSLFEYVSSVAFACALGTVVYYLAQYLNAYFGITWL